MSAHAPGHPGTSYPHSRQMVENSPRVGNPTGRTPVPSHDRRIDTGSEDGPDGPPGSPKGGPSPSPTSSRPDLDASSYGGLTEGELIAAYGGLRTARVPGYLDWVRVGVLNGWKDPAELEALLRERGEP